jgi:hypothetical protein
MPRPFWIFALFSPFWLVRCNASADSYRTSSCARRNCEANDRMYCTQWLLPGYLISGTAQRCKCRLHTTVLFMTRRLRYWGHNGQRLPGHFFLHHVGFGEHIASTSRLQILFLAGKECRTYNIDQTKVSNQLHSYTENFQNSEATKRKET